MKRYLWLLALAALTVTAFALLLVARRPDPLPNPNGYDDFVAAGKMVVGKPGEVATNGPAALAAFAAQNAGVGARVRAGFVCESRVPVKMNQGWLVRHRPDCQAVTDAGNTLGVIAHQLETEGRVADSLAVHLDCVRLATESVRGGLAMDYLTGTSLELSAVLDLQQLTPKLNAALCRQTLKALQETDAAAEPLMALVERERQWRWWVSGWWRTSDGIKARIEELRFRPSWTSASVSSIAHEEHMVVLLRGRLSLALARRAFTLEQGRPPASDAELVPAYLPALPPVAPPAK